MLLGELREVAPGVGIEGLLRSSEPEVAAGGKA